MDDRDDFWNRPEQVERFAGREPDVRLVPLTAGYRDPAATRVLDLGCAAGRNTVFLAERGFDVWALDASPAMAERTRQRLGEILGPTEADRRVRVGRMDDLTAYGDGRFDLIVALGILHNAGSVAEWDRTLSEVRRVLRSKGRLLVASFAPGTDLTGEGVRRTEAAEHVYEMGGVGRLYLLDAAGLDEAMAGVDLRPETPTETVIVDMDPGRRVVVNALYGTNQ
jgi:SAM-dependent methyltransferase